MVKGEIDMVDKFFCLFSVVFFPSVTIVYSRVKVYFSLAGWPAPTQREEQHSGDNKQQQQG